MMTHHSVVTSSLGIKNLCDFSSDIEVGQKYLEMSSPYN